MNAHEFASAVAKYIDAETGLRFGSQLIKQRSRMLKKVIPDSRIAVALEETIMRIAPLDKGQLMPAEEVRSARLVAAVLIGAASIATSEISPSKEHWGSCEKHTGKLVRTLQVFLQEICGRPTRKERDEDTLHALQEKIGLKLNESHEERAHIGRMFNWGALLCEPAVLVEIADAIRELENEMDQGERLALIRDIIVERNRPPSMGEIREILQIITTPPAGKA